MSKTVNKIEANKPNLIEAIKALKPRQSIDNKAYPDYNKGLKAVLDVCYKVYQAREKGTATAEAESKAMAEVTAFLHTLGKANGKYISVCEKTTENGISSVLFDTLVYHSFRDRIYTKSATLASLECEKAKASKAKAEAHAKLMENKGTATAYKEAVKAYDEAVKAVQAEREKANAEGTLTEKESISKFAKFATARLKAIIENRYAISPEEAEALRKIRNKEAKEKRTEAKPEAPKGSKKPEAKKPESKPATAKAKKPEAVKEAPKASPEAVKKTA
jgi:hypothetical protein